MRHGTPYEEVINAFAEDEEGGMWIASGQGMYRFQQGRMQRIAAGAWFGVIRAAHGLMLGTKNEENADAPIAVRLHRFHQQDGSWTDDPMGDIRIYLHRELSADTSGNVFFPCDDMPAPASYPKATWWCELTSSVIRNWNAASRTTVPLVRHSFQVSGVLLTKIAHDYKGCTWFLTFNPVFRQCPDDTEPVRLPESVATIYPQISTMADGNVALLSSGAGLALEEHSKFLIANHRNGLPGGSSLLVAHDGTIWIGGGNGLSRFPYPFRLEYWTGHDGLETGYAFARVGSELFSGSGRDIVKLETDRSRWTVLPHGTGLGTVLQLVSTPRHTLYAMVYQKGMFELSLDGSVMRSLKNGETSAWRLLRARNGQLWVSGPGVGHIVEGNGKDGLVEIPESLPGMNTLANDIGASEDGRLWVCYADGLAVRQPSGWRLVARRGPNLPSSCSVMAVHPDGDIWYGYVPPVIGLARIHYNPPDNYSHPQIQPYTHDGDPGFFPTFVNVDHRKWIWVGANGLYFASTKQAELQQWWRLSELDGLPSLSSNEHAFMEDSDGSIWFSAEDNIVHFNPPHDFVEATSAPNVFVSGFSWNGTAPRLSETVESFKHGSSIVAYIGSLQFDRRNALMLRYRLLPEETSWKQTSTFDLKLGILRWGSHTLEVQARLGPGPWSQTASHTFTVLKPVWLTWPVLLGFTVFGVAAGSAGTVWHKKRVEREKKALPDLAEWRLAALVPEGYELIGIALDGRFSVEKVLARGGFATVFEGQDVDTHQRCAVKVFRKELAGQDWLTRQFRQEVAALESIQHPNVVRIYGHGTTPGAALYLAMEFVDGYTLRDVLAQGPLSPPTAASLLRQAGSALDQLHSKGIYHRDLKPENIMIREHAMAGGELVLIDFSIAIVKDANESIHGMSRAAGTFHYMPPEQVLGHAEPASDIYSLAKVFIEMLAGQSLPNLLPDASLDLSRRLPALLVKLSIPLSEGAVVLLCSALEFDPAKRPRQAGNFANLIAFDLEHS